jgi:hypothetical protein
MKTNAELQSLNFCKKHILTILGFLMVATFAEVPPSLRAPLKPCFLISPDPASPRQCHARSSTENPSLPHLALHLNLHTNRQTVSIRFRVCKDLEWKERFYAQLTYNKAMLTSLSVSLTHNPSPKQTITTKATWKPCSSKVLAFFSDSGSTHRMRARNRIKI